ncbi:hypothetical protein [Lacticaseibacillus camelliae]|uniref:Uncharacterized protein n=2 Tax=Lacticaseibacillus camelliae TaxID=381742 RepID=A0A0R2FAM3_9LACO|nr:hypothetical protein [Lacticaseibacillus camelliae]KRN25410.1 hypothetical protein FC75_GL000434 [Lacticaseibacillus camelliae DSM 22697 = JCM 13995]
MLTIEGWVMDGQISYVIDPGGELDLLPTLVIYADSFWNARGEPLSVTSQPIQVEFNHAVAWQKTVWTLGERLRATGRVTAVNITKTKQHRAIQQTRQEIITVDQNALRAFATGLLRRDNQLARVAKWRAEYLRGNISLNTLQNQENRIFAREGRVWLELLARMHDKQLTIRRQALPALLAGSRTTYLLRAPFAVQRTVAAPPQFIYLRHNSAGQTGAHVIMKAKAREPTVMKKQTLDPAKRRELLNSLRRFRRNWLAAGRPVDALPPASPSLKEKQQAWLSYEEARSS